MNQYLYTIEDSVDTTKLETITAECPKAALAEVADKVLRNFDADDESGSYDVVVHIYATPYDPEENPIESCTLRILSPADGWTEDELDYQL